MLPALLAPPARADGHAVRDHLPAMLALSNSLVVVLRAITSGTTSWGCIARTDIRPAGTVGPLACTDSCTLLDYLRRDTMVLQRSREMQGLLALLALPAHTNGQ